MARPAHHPRKSPPRHPGGTSTRPANASATPGGPGADPARQALAWTHTARFLTTAAQLNQLPVNELPEVAFVGRSNAGKSTAINTLAQQRQLAYASKTPGRTQHINLFELGPKDAPNLVWADLPGYGYAAVEREAKVRWQQVMARYLEVRRNLTGVVQMVDCRHGFTDLDLQLLSFVAPRVRTGEVKLLVLLTKADKLNRKEQAESLAKAQQALGDVVTDEADVGIALFSALNKTGVGDAAQVLQGWSELTEALRERLAMPDTLPPESNPDEDAPEGTPDQPA
jgi:GTP-binding protein